MTQDPTSDDEHRASDHHADASDDHPDAEHQREEARRVLSKLVGGLQGEAGKVLRSLIDRNPVSTESAEHLLDVFFRLLNRREVVERLLRSEFMRNVRDMNSELTETIGFASQSDVQELRQQLAEVITRLDKLQKTLDDIVVEVEEK